MQRMRRWTREHVRVVLGCLTAAIAVLAAVPQPAPAATVTAREPAYGLPHFYADTDLELVRLAGREIAKDRLVQMILFARSGRGTLHQPFGLLTSAFLPSDISTRRTAYTSSELNNMYAKMPQRERDLVLEYCKGVNDTIEDIYAGNLPEPVEIGLLRGLLGLGGDLFGNATNISDQVDPFYKAPGGADPERPNAGFQYTPETVLGVGLQLVRQFSLHSFDEDERLEELQTLVGLHGSTLGAEIWDDLNFLNDPLAPATVPDPNLPGYGGPLAAAPRSVGKEPTKLAAVAERYPRYGYGDAARQRRETDAQYAELTAGLGLHPRLASYAWVIGGGKTATGYPWLGGFPQLGIQVPSIPHFMEFRSGEPGGINAVGGFGVVGAIVGVGHTDGATWTATTAELRVIDTFFEEIVNENTDALRYNDEGTPGLLSKRTEIFRGFPTVSRVFWRSHERNGNGGSRAVVEFMGDRNGTADSGTATTLVDAGAFDSSYIGGHVAIVDGVGAGQIRAIGAVPNANTVEVELGEDWTTVPNSTSVYVAVKPGNNIIAVAEDNAAWLEETATILGFLLFQRADSVLDIRQGSRVLASTFNFTAADNKPFNGIGTASGTGGNIGYFSTGFSRVRQDASDPRLPLDGTGPNPLVVVSGVVDTAGAATLTATTPVFTGKNFTAPAVNFRYNDPSQQGSEFVAVITGGGGYKQSRRIASNTNDTLTIEFPWGVTPSNGDTFEVIEIYGMPEAVNPAEGYMANWNGKAATADNQIAFGRQGLSNVFKLERLAVDNSWDRPKQRQLNKDLAGLRAFPRDPYGRYLVPRLRQAVDAVGNGGNPDVDTVLAALEAHNASPFFGRRYVDPVDVTRTAGEIDFLSSLITQLTQDIYGNEFGGITPPFGGLNHVVHAIDSAAGDVPGSYTQSYSGDYFDGTAWEEVVRDSLSALASGGIPADTPHAACEGPDLYTPCKFDDDCTDDLACPGGNCRCLGNSTYNHPLIQLFPELAFEPTPEGNRGTYEQIIDVGPVITGEFVFPLGQSGHLEGTLGGGITLIDPNFTTLQPVWRDWRFVPILRVSQDLGAGGSPDPDGDGVWDAFERWYYGNTARGASDDGDGDGSPLIDEFLAGSDPTDSDTDDDGILDGLDAQSQDRLRSGLLALRGRLRRAPTPDRDVLSLRGQLGTTDQFDLVAADGITVTVRDDADVLYTVTLQGSDFTVAAGGRLFRYDDPTGSNSDLRRLSLRLNSNDRRGSRWRLKTVRTDFSAVALADRDVEVEISIGTHTALDRRPWEVRGVTLNATR
jgi:hypothetical protein